MVSLDIKEFQTVVWDFYSKNKRDFPWRQTKDPYKILVSEIMLQQTQAPRVVDYYKKWLKRFPDIQSLASASFAQIYPFWQGLGYNRRALALQKLAKKVTQKYQGKLPLSIPLLEELPGVGPYTARAVSIFAHNRPITCLETNIRRVFIHHFFFDRRSLGEGGSESELVTDKDILEIAKQALPAGKARQWHWALMDYGAYLKSVVKNPNRRHKNYSVQSKFEGSLRQIRGSALRILSVGTMEEKELFECLKKATGQTKERVKKVILALEKEGLIRADKNGYSLY